MSSYQSIRATALHHHASTSSPEVLATIAASKDDVSIRISDQGCPSPPLSAGGSSRMRKTDTHTLAVATRGGNTKCKDTLGSVFFLAHPELGALG